MGAQLNLKIVMDDQKTPIKPLGPLGSGNKSGGRLGAPCNFKDVCCCKAFRMSHMTDVYLSFL